MTARRVDSPPRAAGKASVASQAEAREGACPALTAPPKERPPSDSGLPGGGRGRVDLTGIIPPGIHVDPDITEGHPGYEESGDSEIIPPSRLTGRTGEGEGRAG